MRFYLILEIEQTELNIFKEGTQKNQRLNYISLGRGVQNCLHAQLTLFCENAVPGSQILSMWHHWLLCCPSSSPAATQHSFTTEWGPESVSWAGTENQMQGYIRT